MPGKKGFRYAYSPAHIETILGKIQKSGRPDELTMPYIKSTWLLKNNQYGAVLVILRDMEFIDSSGKPLELYKKYQNPHSAKMALAEGVKRAYTELFKAFPDADSQPKSFIKGYFKEKTGAEDSVLEKIVSTFITLCGLSNFGDIKGFAEGVKESAPKMKPDKEGTTTGVSLEPKIQVNIGINISPDTPDEKIKLIFKNMREYLIPKSNEEEGG